METRGGKAIHLSQLRTGSNPLATCSRGRNPPLPPSSADDARIIRQIWECLRTNDTLHNNFRRWGHRDPNTWLQHTKNLMSRHSRSAGTCLWAWVHFTPSKPPSNSKRVRSPRFGKVNESINIKTIIKAIPCFSSTLHLRKGLVPPHTLHSPSRYSALQTECVSKPPQSPTASEFSPNPQPNNAFTRRPVINTNSSIKTTNDHRPGSTKILKCL